MKEEIAAVQAVARSRPWLRWLALGALWAVLNSALLLGSLALLRPKSTAAPPAIEKPSADLSFPVKEGEAFAVVFASLYMEWDAATPQTRADRLAPYIPEGADRQFGWAANGKQGAVLTLPVETVVTSPNSAVIEVAIEVSGLDAPRFLHLEVPVFTDGAGRFIVTDTPVLVPGPDEAVPPVIQRVVDPALSDQLREPLSAFFRAYAGSDPGALTYLLAPGVRLGTLGGTVTFEALELEVPVGGSEREALAKVRWIDSVTESTYTQTYQVSIVKGPDGRWYVQRLGAHGPAGAPFPQ